VLGVEGAWVSAGKRERLERWRKEKMTARTVCWKSWSRRKGSVPWRWAPWAEEVAGTRRERAEANLDL